MLLGDAEHLLAVVVLEANESTGYGQQGGYPQQGQMGRRPAVREGVGIATV